MGSVGEGYICPLCGRVDGHAYAFDHVGYPTCFVCNFRRGLPSRSVILTNGQVTLPPFANAWWTRRCGGICEGELPIDIRRRQLQVILAPNGAGKLSGLVFERLIIDAIANFLLP